jgi:hypothetical protein
MPPQALHTLPGGDLEDLFDNIRIGQDGSLPPDQPTLKIFGKSNGMSLELVAGEKEIRKVSCCPN